MRLMVLGAGGMLGHKLTQVLSRKFNVCGTVRSEAARARVARLGDGFRVMPGVGAEAFDTVKEAVREIQPDAVINAIGVVKQREEAQDPVASIAINALFPHRLASLCRAGGARLIHFSTDCVFTGRRGPYAEGDTADAEDLYGRTKLLGELNDPGCLTLRTSMIGRELGTRHGLLEWFLSQEGGKVRGYRKAVFSGLTTIALAEIIAALLTERPDLEGLWNVASKPMDKHRLLTLIKEVYDLEVRLEPDETVVCDRSLKGEPFWKALGRRPPSWEEMIQEMYQDPTPYSKLGGENVHG